MVLRVSGVKYVEGKKYFKREEMGRTAELIRVYSFTSI